VFTLYFLFVIYVLTNCSKGTDFVALNVENMPIDRPLENACHF